jgi:hypothetical protein
MTALLLSNYKIGNGPHWQHLPSDAALEEPSAAIAAGHSVMLPRRLVATHTTQRLVFGGRFHPATAVGLCYTSWDTGDSGTPSDVAIELTRRC